MLLFRAIAVLSAAAIGYEILLMRLLSITQWHHFAYLIISLALLGYGASGTFLTLTQHWLLPRFAMVFISSAVLFSLSTTGSFVLAQQLPFILLEVMWDYRQWVYLLTLYLLFCVPFFCAATCIGLTFARFKEHIGHIYRSDLLGAGGDDFGHSFRFHRGGGIGLGAVWTRRGSALSPTAAGQTQRDNDKR